jgi:hypothetical protein
VVLPGALTLAVLTALVALRAFTWLDSAGRKKVYEELVKLSYQFLVIVLLGALITKLIDDARDRRAAQAEQVERQRNDEAQRRDRQRGYVRRLVNDSHGVDLARMLILANRSTETWSQQMNERIISSYIDLRDIGHDARTASASNDPIFLDWKPIQESIERMERVLKDLIDEYGEKRKELSELQLKAEKDRTLQEQLWKRLLALPYLGDLLAEEGEKYGQFRKEYQAALGAMRDNLAKPASNILER